MEADPIVRPKMPELDTTRGIATLLVLRHERLVTIYSAFFHIACFMIVLRRVLK